MARSVLILSVFASLMGAAGVALAAAASHSGAPLASLASQFLILHAATLLAAAALANQAPRRNVSLLLSAVILGAGTVIFCADLSARAFTGARLAPMMAPAGGTLMIIGWLMLAATFAAMLRRGAR